MRLITFMSSAGLRIFFGCVKETRASGGDFRIVSPSEKVAKLLKLAGFLNVVKNFNTVDEAVASFGAANE
jgi:anti-anti-sigma factor